MALTDRRSPARLADGAKPRLLVVIDTEEEFDWDRPLSRSNTATRSIAAQVRAQEIFAKHAVTPTYVIDFPVATDSAAAGLLREFAEDGRCVIGSHLHPWVNPPHDEAVTPVNSYPGNLERSLEKAKLEVLTESIAERFGAAPTIYKAGRYGVGPRTAGILEELGYRIDLSVVPYTSFTADGGPDFRGFDFPPFWFGEADRLLEIPVTCGFCGALRSMGRGFFPWLSAPLGMSLHLPGVASRLGLLERIRLSPEGAGFQDLRRLADSLLEQGCQVFSLTYHSPSLAPGHTPYVRDEHELEAFLETIERFLDYFIGAKGGEPTTPEALYADLESARVR